MSELRSAIEVLQAEDVGAVSDEQLEADFTELERAARTLEAVGDPPPPVAPAGGLSVDGLVARGPASAGVDGRLERDPDGAIAREDAAHQASPGHGRADVLGRPAAHMGSTGPSGAIPQGGALSG